MELRPYQIQAQAAIFEQWLTVNKTLLVLPTGTGKTIVFAKVAEEMVRRGKRVLILAHRFELLEQASDKIKTATGLTTVLEKAGNSCLNSWFRIVVGSVQTLQSKKRLEKFPVDYFDVIIVDEAHHSLSNSYQTVLNHFNGAKVLGVTATPDRGDMRNLGQYFESLAYEYSLPKAIKDKYLTPIKAQTIPLKIDLAGVSTQAGDYKTADLGDALEPYLFQIAEEMKTYAKGRKTVVFLPLIKTSQKFKELLTAAGFRAAEVNGESKDRAEILKDFENGKYDVICNSMLLTEGWDSPAVDCIVVLRPTKIRSLFCQMVGRGTRIKEGKDYLLILDFLWQTKKHELCHPAHLIATSADGVEKMTERIDEDGGPVDLEEAEMLAARDDVEEREQALAKELAAMRTRKRTLVDPLQFEFSIQAEDLAGYIPAFGWECGPASETQISMLEKFGIFTDQITNAGKASLILNKLIARKNEGLTTPKQIRLLENKGFKHVGQWPFEAATKMISQLAMNKWRVPNGINVENYDPRNGAPANDNR